MSTRESEPAPFFLHRRLGRVVLIRMLRTASTIAEVEDFAAQIGTLHRAAGQPLLVVSLPPTGLTPPPEAVRSEILRRIKERFARGHIELGFLVFPMGNPFTRALLRSFFSGARLVLGLRRQLVLVDELADAARELERLGGIRASDLIQAAAEISDPR
jgi:hypothetical protein